MFIKRTRQTSRHRPELSVARDPEDYQRIRDAYDADEILHWQRPVVRRFVPLQPAEGTVPGRLRPSVEVRTFWWHGRMVASGRYWYQIPPYGRPGLDDGLALAWEAAGRLAVPLLVVDIARTADGRWMVIECNDAQEAGYCAISPQLLWRAILER